MTKKIFIHIPKNAGSAIKYFLSSNVVNSKHHLDPEYKKQLEKTFPGKQNDHTGNAPNYTHCRWRDFTLAARNNFQAFAVVRNPWSRVVSRYTFREIIRKNQGVYKFKTFEEFLEERLLYGNKKHFWHRAVDGWFPQKDYVVDGTENLRCDILRYEQLEKDVAKYFGSGSVVKWKNVSNGNMATDRNHVSKRRDYREFYTTETQQIVANWYAEDIEFFGFTFEGPATKNIWNK